MAKWIDRIIVTLVVLTACSIWSYAADRESLYRQFGPKEIEAIVMVIKDELNILRATHGLSVRTNAQMIYAIESELNGISDYDWMSEGP